MNLNVQSKLRSNLNNVRYLRENSYWYKYLNRSDVYLNEFINEMKIKYKLTPVDRIDKFSKNIDKVSQLIDIFL